MSRVEQGRRWPSFLVRWCLIGALGSAVAGCGTPDQRADGAAKESRPGAVRSSQWPDERERGGRPLPLTPVVERDVGDDGRNGGLTRAEFYSGSGVLARAGGRPGDVAVDENGQVTLNFANADIREVIDIVLGDTLNLSYIIDPGVKGTVTVRTSQPLSREDVIPALENILALNGLAMTPIDGTYVVVPREAAAATLSSPVVSPSARQLARGFGINIIPLRYVSAAAMREIVEPFLNPSSLRADTARNLLIFSGKSSDARALMDMISVFDVDWMQGMSFALLPVEVADAKDMVAELENVFLQEGESPVAGLLRFVPIERLNAVLAISPQPAYLEQAKVWIDRLDRGSTTAGRQIFVYYVENARAENLADVLGQVFGSGTTRAREDEGEVAPGLAPLEISTEEAAQLEGRLPRTRTEPETSREAGVGEAIVGSIDGVGDIRITADDAHNALIILATATEFRMIEATLRKLDIVPLQVLIEVTIAEVGLNDVLQYGLQWFFEHGEATAAFSSVGTTFKDIAGGAGFFPGFNFLFDSNDQRALLQALTDITEIEVISSPSLMVLDNQSARLQVGDQVPFETGSSAQDPGEGESVFTTVQQLDTGVILEVTPRVNPGGLVTMEISQEVSTSTPTEGASATQPTIRQRKIESTVAVQSGDTIALGGLIRDDVTESERGFPLLSDIPILGHLFKTTQDIKTRTELLVLITPRVVSNRIDALEVTEELRRRLKSIAPLEQKIKAPRQPSS